MVFIIWALCVYAVINIGSALWTSYMSSYLKAKAANLATHEDIQRVVDQVSIVTRTTEQIKAEISNDVWDRQKQWEMKREATFGAAKTVSDIDNCISALDVSTRNRNDDDPKWLEENRQVEQAWNRAADGYELTLIQIEITCSSNTIGAMHEFHEQASDCARFLLQSRIGEAQRHYRDLSVKRVAVIRALRSELGFETKHQSTESSAGPSPDSPIPE